MKEENLKILQREAEKKITEAQVQYLITKLQKEYNSDILGLWRNLRESTQPKASEIFKEEWRRYFCKY